MHELSLIESVLEELIHLKSEHQLNTITDVHLLVGEVSGVDPRFLQSSFEMAISESIWSHLRIHIIINPWQIQCDDCHHHQNVVNQNPACQVCGSFHTRTTSGREFIIQRIEGEADV